MKRYFAALTATVALSLLLTGCGKTTTAVLETPAELAERAEMATDYRHMLLNAHVHDTDGFLLDGENAHYDTFA